MILTYIEGFMKDRSGVLNFPERGFMFSLKKMGHGDALVKFTDREDKRAAVGREKDILAALTSGAVEFFSAVLDSSPKTIGATEGTSIRHSVCMRSAQAFNDLADHLVADLSGEEMCVQRGRAARYHAFRTRQH